MSKQCRRLQGEALLTMERGFPLDEHFTTCTNCRDAAAAYRELFGLLTSAGHSPSPPSGWQGRVWERLLAPSAIAQRLKRLLPPPPDPVVCLAGGAPPFALAFRAFTRTKGERLTEESEQLFSRLLLLAVRHALREAPADIGRREFGGRVESLLVYSPDAYVPVALHIVYGKYLAELALAFGTSQTVVEALSSAAREWLQEQAHFEDASATGIA